MKPNHAHFAKQSNVASGHKIYPCSVDTTGKEAHLATLANVGGVATAKLPALEADPVHAVIGEGGENEATLFFPAPGDTFRVKLTGAANPMASLTSVGDGTVEAGGAGPAYATAEEAGVDGQFILARKL